MKKMIDSIKTIVSPFSMIAILIAFLMLLVKILEAFWSFLGTIL